MQGVLLIYCFYCIMHLYSAVRLTFPNKSLRLYFHSYIQRNQTMKFLPVALAQLAWRSPRKVRHSSISCQYSNKGTQSYMGGSAFAKEGCFCTPRIPPAIYFPPRERTHLLLFVHALSITPIAHTEGPAARITAISTFFVAESVGEDIPDSAEIAKLGGCSTLVNINT